MRLAIIVPTIGRETLVRTLDSLRPQVQREMVLIATDCDDEKEEWVKSVAGEFWVVPVRSRTPFGHHASNTALDLLPKWITHTWRIDDDDVATPHALAILRSCDCRLPVFLRMELSPDNLIWIEPELEEGNIGSPCILAPRSDARWGERYEGDFDYAKALVKELGEPLWVDQVVAKIRP
jgi:glycosyltransferase involved in cell wall biosynthesis